VASQKSETVDNTDELSQLRKYRSDQPSFITFHKEGGCCIKIMEHEKEEK